MKQLFNILAVAVLSLSVVSCSKNSELYDNQGRPIHTGGSAPAPAPTAAVTLGDLNVTLPGREITSTDVDVKGIDNVVVNVSTKFTSDAVASVQVNLVSKADNSVLKTYNYTEIYQTPYGIRPSLDVFGSVPAAPKFIRWIPSQTNADYTTTPLTNEPEIWVKVPTNDDVLNGKNFTVEVIVKGTKATAKKSFNLTFKK